MVGYSDKEKSVEDERLRIVKTAAAIIMQDIRASVFETETCPPVDNVFESVDSQIPKTLQTLLFDIVTGGKKSNTDKLKPKYLVWLIVLYLCLLYTSRCV